MDLHNQLDKVHNIQLYSAIILWSSYKLTIMINDTVAQSSTDSSAIQIPKYFFKIIFLIINFLACFPHLLFIIFVFGLNTVSKDFLYVCMCTHVYICTYI